MSDMQEAPYEVSPEEEEAGYAMIGMKKDCGVPECDLQGTFHKHWKVHGGEKTIEEIREEVCETNEWKAQRAKEQHEVPEKEWLQSAFPQEDGTIKLWRPMSVERNGVLFCGGEPEVIASPSDKLYTVLVQKHKRLAVGKKSSLFRYRDGHIEEEVE